MSKQTTTKDTVKNHSQQYEHSTVHPTTPIRPDRLSIIFETCKIPTKN